MSTTALKVSGMTCGHCVAAVREQVAAVPGVTGVQVDVATGTVTVTSSGPLPAEAVHAAIRAAGYALAS
ncbi:Putative metal-binding protein [Mycobacteroides abscessus]|uniref:Metal-binding protein n=6 Tax=Mycobacteroides abscessus TaxID=36809 RepID=B1MGL9_MYCA9|nr:heavy-metal-associated domain-containing protein [Mycobacteroides abscessus]EUA64245.1 heavy-metal-associated domain protein [Mycobacteroides abscessus 1948]AIC72975.1 metal-binding protein [Mycobacteroides abscessus subsp. massiliense str. GO 06]ALM15239.1 metal-binding protein [Mycobacteroides abscessus]AMU24509.1 metal-binding protein [Mycobacteroides abscessus]AMU34239.1 metal-binding protein [Mycobacteroides abscessus]